MMKMSTDIQRVWMDPAAHEKLWAWVGLAKGEVSMLGLVEEFDGEPCVTDIFLVKQTCTPASTDMDLPHLDVTLGTYRENVRRIRPSANLFEVSALTGVGMDVWVKYLESLVNPGPTSADG